MIWLPIATAVLSAVGILGRKLLFLKTRIPMHEFLTTASLLHAGLAILIAWTVLDLPISHFAPLVRTPGLLVTGAYVAIAAVSLYLFYLGFREETVGRYDLAAVLDPLFIFIVAGLVFPAERDLRIYLAAGLALGVFALVHLHGRRLQFEHGERILLLASFLFGIEATLERLLLESISPFELYLVRAVALAAVFTLMFGFHFHKHILSRRFLWILGIVIVGFLYTLGLFMGYATFGVTVTNLVLLLGPVLIYLYAYLVLREHQTWKIALAGGVILATVAYALWLIG